MLCVTLVLLFSCRRQHHDQMQLPTSLFLPLIKVSGFHLRHTFIFTARSLNVLVITSTAKPGPAVPMVDRSKKPLPAFLSKKDSDKPGTTDHQKPINYLITKYLIELSFLCLCSTK